MKAEILAVGNEVIMGHTVNTNASYIAKRLKEYGIGVKYHIAVGDCKEDIEEALAHALSHAEYIFIIGGLGPTQDDLTKETVCQYLKKHLVFYPSIYEGIVAYFAKTNRITPENNRKQAYFPEDASILDNHNGTAPGCMIPVENKKIFLLPGPPNELIPIFNNEVCPYLEKDLKEVYYTLDIKCFGIGESHLAQLAGDLLGEFEDTLIAPYVSNLEVIIRICTWKTSIEAARQEAERYKNKIEERLRPYIIGYNEETIEENILKLLQTKQYSVTTAESCTGGLLAGTLVNCGGISNYFKEGIVTYSNEAKMKYLHVKEETLNQFGAVSYEIAKEMAEGVRQTAGAHIGLATTGIAGPDGGTEEKPVGLVYIGIALPGETFVYELHLQGDRQSIRLQAVKHTLYQLYKKLK